MPRNLTDLMEAAVSAAPPETHHAADITHLAERRQRRRTTFVAAGAALGVIAVAGLTVGLSQNHPSTPQPSGPEPYGPYRYGQHQAVSDAVPAGAGSGFHTLTYDVPSVHPAQGSFAAVALWADVDPQGRLLAGHLTRNGPGATVTYMLADGPGQAAHQMAAPVSSAPSAQQGEWRWSFTDDDRLLWFRPLSSGLGVDAKVTALDGTGGAAVRASFDAIPVQGTPGVPTGRTVWIQGDRAYYDVVTREPDFVKSPTEFVSLFSSQLGSSAAPRAESPTDALEISVADHKAVWVDATGRHVFVTSLTSGERKTVPIPLESGCHLPPPYSYFQENQRNLQTNGSLVAVTEFCGESERIVVSDLSGRLVTVVDPGDGALVAMNLGERSLVFADTKPFTWYADDLVTGRLVRLGDVGEDGIHNLPLSADFPASSASGGSYVLWYDKDGGHVGEFTG